MPGIKRRRLGVALTLAAALLSHPVRAADHYDLHFIISLTGSGAFLAKSEQQAIGTAAQLINRNGGIHGKTLVPVFHDDQSSPQVAVQLVSEVLSLHPAIIIGSTSAALCNAMAPLVADGPVLYCLSPAVHGASGSYLFEVQIDSHDQQRALLTYFRGKGWKRVALITTSDASGQDAEKSIGDLMKESGFQDMQLVADTHFAPSDVSVAAQVETMRAAQPDAIVTWATAATGGIVFRALRQAGLDLPTAASGSNMSLQQMIGYAAFLPQRLFFGVGEWAANGDSRLSVSPDIREQQKLFFTSLAVDGVLPDSGMEVGWESLRVVADALNHLPPDADARQLRDFLATWSGHVGAEGHYDFKKTPQRGLAIDSAVVMRWDPGAKEWHLVSNLTGTPIE